jgi:hypothetical protein
MQAASTQMDEASVYRDSLIRSTREIAVPHREIGGFCF